MVAYDFISYSVFKYAYRSSSAGPVCVCLFMLFFIIGWCSCWFLFTFHRQFHSVAISASLRSLHISIHWLRKSGFLHIIIRVNTRNDSDNFVVWLQCNCVRSACITINWEISFFVRGDARKIYRWGETERDREKMQNDWSIRCHARMRNGPPKCESASMCMKTKTIRKHSRDFVGMRVRVVSLVKCWKWKLWVKCIQFSYCTRSYPCDMHKAISRIRTTRTNELAR